MSYADVDLIGEERRQTESFKEALTGAGAGEMVVYDGGNKNGTDGDTGKKDGGSSNTDGIFRFEKGPCGDESVFIVSIDQNTRKQMGHIFNKT